MEEVAYDDGNPIFLPNMTASDLELVFGWLSHKWQYNDESLGKQDLISLLRAGRFFMMPSLMRWVLKAFNNLTEPLSSIEKIALSQELPIVHTAWIRPSIGALITMRLDTFRFFARDIAARLDSSIITTISVARQTLSDERIALAFSYRMDPTVGPGIGCSIVNHIDICCPGWSVIWWSVIAQIILNPSPTPGGGDDNGIEDLRKLPDILRRTDWKDIPDTCVEEFIQYLEGKGIFNVEEEIIDAATEAVIEYLKGVHMNWKEFDFSKEDQTDAALLNRS
ncbi:hypothetical protein C8R42DRAFT_728677 [Lentinula raphanica]|nr:hypothetical protein C8R42DRAFT_728677 [Lentinula raphanica]